jgi:enoyl-CoA hydratase/carnithine racemase
MKPAAARDIMKAETWYTAQEALDAGFVSEVIADKTAKASAFDYAIYMHAPASLPRRPLQPPPAIAPHAAATTPPPGRRSFHHCRRPHADARALISESATCAPGRRI